MRLPSDTPDRITGQAVTRCGALPRFAPDLPCGVQLSLPPATMNLIRVIRSAGRRRRRRPGAATSPAHLSLLLSPWGREKTATVAKHAVLIMHRTDIRTHRDGWVVVERHKDTTHTTPLLTLHTLTSHVVCHRILVFATMRAAPRR